MPESEQTLNFLIMGWIAVVILGLIAAIVLWRRWQAPWWAKLLTVLGLFFLLEPFACFVALPWFAGVHTGAAHPSAHPTMLPVRPSAPSVRTP